ncbi:hypothetical protein Tco_0977224 [Tanacetum coccineum]|uniref:Uncharacterized protein n=1 Tax=Tanacetum coccineum TaxID=301880 RepID=A0ABQ5EJZ5_9ASTR
MVIVTADADYISPLDAFCQKYHTYDSVHPELPGPNQSIRNSPDEMDLFSFIRYADPTKCGLAVAANKPKGTRGKRKATGGASGSNHPPNKLKEDHDTSGDVSASTGRKSLATIQDLFERSTLNVEVGVVAAATVPSVTSSMTPTLEREGDGNTYSISGKNLCTQCPSERFVISSDPSHHSSTNATDVEVASIVRSPILSPPLMTVTVTTTVVARTLSAPVIGAEAEPVSQLSPPGLFSQLHSMDYDQLFVEFNVGATRQACLSAEEAEATEGVHLHNQVFVVEDAESARVSELNSLKEHNSSLDLELSCDELSVKAASLESQRDGFANQVSLLENTCSGLHDQVSGYELFKEQCEYGAAFRAVICLAIYKGIQTRLVAGIDHGKARRDLADIAAYDPSVEARYVSAILDFYDLDFNLLSHLESQKDASITAILSLLLLEGPSAETLEVSWLQPSYAQLLFLIHRKEDNVVTGGTSLSDSLDVVHACVQKLKESALSHCFSISDAMGVLAYLLSSENLISEASTLGVPVMAATTTALAISVTATNINSILPILVANYDMHDAGV